MRKLTSIAAATAVVLTSLGAGSAQADARGRHHGGGWHHRHDDGIDAGDVIGGLFIIGAIAAIASAASKDRHDGDYRYRPPLPEDDRDADDRDDGPWPVATDARDEVEQRAIDACSWAAEADMGDGARVESITGTRPDQGYGWYVAGTVARSGERGTSFGCTYRNGRVADVNFG